MEVRWQPSFSASCAHATVAFMMSGKLVDESLATAIAPGAIEIASTLQVAGAKLGEFSEHFCALAVGLHNNRELADVALSKTVGRRRRDDHVLAIARGIATIEAAITAARPKLAEELELRAGPLREQWEARGPGLLAKIGRLTEPDLLVERADIALVEPVQGGGGAAHLPYNSVRIEAVLANPHEQLPEVLCLAWLLAQLQLDLPMYSEQLAPPHRRTIPALAMLPPVLAAAEEVELSKFDPALVQLMCEAWLTNPPWPAVAAAPVLAAWWETYLQATPPWPVALGALEKMLGSAEAAK